MTNVKYEMIEQPDIPSKPHQPQISHNQYQVIQPASDKNTVMIQRPDSTQMIQQSPLQPSPLLHTPPERRKSGMQPPSEVPAFKPEKPKKRIFTSDDEDLDPFKAPGLKSIHAMNGASKMRAILAFMIHKTKTKNGTYKREQEQREAEEKAREERLTKKAQEQDEKDRQEGKPIKLRKIKPLQKMKEEKLNEPVSINGVLVPPVKIPFRCPYCTMQFPCRIKLKNHLKKKHPNGSPESPMKDVDELIAIIAKSRKIQMVEQINRMKVLSRRGTVEEEREARSLKEKKAKADAKKAREQEKLLRQQKLKEKNEQKALAAKRAQLEPKPVIHKLGAPKKPKLSPKLERVPNASGSSYVSESSRGQNYYHTGPPSVGHPQNIPQQVIQPNQIYKPGMTNGPVVVQQKQPILQGHIQQGKFVPKKETIRPSQAKQFVNRQPQTGNTKL